jgi:hypothetical protein
VREAIEVDQNHRPCRVDALGYRRISFVYDVIEAVAVALKAAAHVAAIAGAE